MIYFVYDWDAIITAESFISHYEIQIENSLFVQREPNEGLPPKRKKEVASKQTEPWRV